MRITIVSATDRPNARALDISNYIKPLYEKEGAHAKVLSLRDFPIESVAGGNYADDIPAITEFITPVIEADGLVFVIPEYNGSYPGILKLMIDHLPFPSAFTGMPVTFIGESKGIFGGLRAVEHFQMVANYRNALQLPERLFIPKVHEEFDAKHGLSDPFKQELLLIQIEKFILFIRNVKKL